MGGYRDVSDEIFTKLLRCRIDLFKEILEGYGGGIDLGPTNNTVEYQNKLVSNPIKFVKEVMTNGSGEPPEPIDFSQVKALASGVQLCVSTKYTKPRNAKIEYLVIHYTAGGNSKPGTAKRTCEMWMASDRPASADFVVDDETIYQYNPDPAKFCCYAVGKPKPGVPYKMNNCVSIEVCSSFDKKRGKSPANANDPGWYFTPATLGNAIKLSKELMSKYSIPKSNVIRHYDVSGKLCPGIIGWNPESGSESEWHKFKNMLA